MKRLENASGDWFASMTPESQDEYVINNPSSPQARERVRKALKDHEAQQMEREAKELQELIEEEKRNQPPPEVHVPKAPSKVKYAVSPPPVEEKLISSWDHLRSKRRARSR